MARLLLLWSSFALAFASLQEYAEDEQLVMMQQKAAMKMQATECMGADCDVRHADIKPHKDEEMLAMMKNDAAVTLKAVCQPWCANHQGDWTRKCKWPTCSACDDCTEAPPVFTVIADEFVNPACDSTEVKDSWANVDSEAECQGKVLAAARDDENINYGVWRGDSTKECRTCTLRANRFAVDYVDLSGAVSFVKPASCDTTFCSGHDANWETKCRWENQQCSGCSDCSAVACTSVGCPACESYCEATTQPWEQKCAYASKDCRGCSACSQEVEAGVFTLQSSTTGQYLSDGDNGVVQSSSAIDGNSQWWFRLNMTTGLYSIKNIDRGLYLSGVPVAGAPVEEVTFQQAAQLSWDAQLDGARRARRYTLMDSASGKFLDVASSGNGIIQSDTDHAWIFEMVPESAVATPSPTTPAPTTPAPTTPAPTDAPASAGSGDVVWTGFSNSQVFGSSGGLQQTGGSWGSSYADAAFTASEGACVEFKFANAGEAMLGFQCGSYSDSDMIYTASACSFLLYKHLYGACYYRDKNVGLTQCSISPDWTNDVFQLCLTSNNAVEFKQNGNVWRTSSSTLDEGNIALHGTFANSGTITEARILNAR